MMSLTGFEPVFLARTASVLGRLDDRDIHTYKWWDHLDSNQEPTDYESGAANQLSYGPMSGALGRIRTCSLQIRSLLPYPFGHERSELFMITILKHTAWMESNHRAELPFTPATGRTGFEPGYSHFSSVLQYGARSRTRTGTPIRQQILSLVCLPIPPPGQDNL